MRIPVLQILFFFITCFLSFGQGTALYAHRNIVTISSQASPGKFESAAAGTNRARRFETGNNISDPAMVAESVSVPTARYQSQRCAGLINDRAVQSQNKQFFIIGSLCGSSSGSAAGSGDQCAMFPDHHFW